jgi:hypothetical protein
MLLGNRAGGYNRHSWRTEMIELTPEQQQALDSANGAPPVVIDSRTQAAYVLIRIEVFEKLKPAAPSDGTPPYIPEMSEGVRRSKAALRRDLPSLLASRRTLGRYVCYHLDERVAVSRDYLALIRECNRRNLPDGTFIIERIKPGAGSEEEIEIESFDV